MQQSTERTARIFDHAQMVDIFPMPVRREVIVDFDTMEIARQELALEPFSIMKYPVSNALFGRFMDGGYEPTDRMSSSGKMFLSHWGEDHICPPHLEDHPVTFVCYDDAVAFARYFHGRLPTYHEWLYATFADRSGAFPWGTDFSSEFCNTRESQRGGTTPIGLYPSGPSNCCDMVGNVWEWTSHCVDDRDDLYLALGPGWDHYSVQREIALNRDYRNHSVGFRVVRNLQCTKESK